MRRRGYRIVAGGPQGPLGRLTGKRGEAWGRDGEPLCGDRMVAAMAVAPARLALFLDVGNFTAGGHFAIATDDAPAPESGEAEKPDETHTPSNSIAEQYACR